jgi:hypothetical protein
VNGSGLGQVESLALRDALDHVHQDHVAQFLLDGVLGDGGADVTGADDRDLGSRHQSVSMLLMMAVPNSEHFTSRAPSIRRAKS